MHTFLPIGVFFPSGLSLPSVMTMQIFIARWFLVVNDRILRHQRNLYCQFIFPFQSSQLLGYAESLT